MSLAGARESRPVGYAGSCQRRRSRARGVSVEACCFPLFSQIGKEYPPCHPQILRRAFPPFSAQGHRHDGGPQNVDAVALNQSSDSSGASRQSHGASTPLKHLPAMALAPFHGVRSSRCSGHGHTAATGRSNVTSFSPPTRARCSSVASDTWREPIIFGTKASNEGAVSAGAVST
jgi:hypothetical protein